MEQEISQSFQEDEVNKHILEQLSEKDKEQVLFGKFSSFIKDFEFPEGTLKDGKIRLNKVNGEVKTEFVEKKPELIIENIPILGKRLKKEDIKKLENGETIKIKNYKGIDLFLKVDSELNQVTVSTSKQLGVINEIGAYKLNSVDKELWIKNEKIGPKVFFNKENQSYFQASIRLKEDGKGIEYHNYKAIPDKNKAQEFIAKFNKGTMLANTAELTNEALNQNQDITKTKSTEQTIAKTETISKMELTDTAFEQHLQNKDLTKIRQMAQNGFKPDGDKLKEMLNKTKLSEEGKREVLVALKVDPTKFQKQFFEKGEDAIDKITGKQVTIQETKEKGVLSVKDQDGKKYDIGSENLKRSSTLDKVTIQQKGMKLPTKSNAITK